MQCKYGCGIELTALNMSDIEEEACQECADKHLNGIDTNDESPETRYMPDDLMEAIVRGELHKKKAYPAPKMRYTGTFNRSYDARV